IALLSSVNLLAYVVTDIQETEQKQQNRARERKEREAKVKIKQKVKVKKSTKVNPDKDKVKAEAVIEELLNEPTRTHLMGRDNPLSNYMKT
ncbi:hypothetical protein Tco_1249255, partial [Tanacetum coccineum]